jgi:hypothetical protein
VFNAGSDPVVFGLVENFRKPGGREVQLKAHYKAFWKEP